ncbi:MAG: FecR domain-containing protein [Polyangiaceae bacterium]
MKFLDSQKDPALDALVEEVRAVAAPKLDWERVQQRLTSAIERDATAVRPEPSLRMFWVLPALAVAACIGLWLLPKSAPESRAQLPVASQEGAVDGDALAKDELLQGGPGGLRVAHAGRAEWTLDPDSTASVIEHEGVIRVRLVSGALRARVVPTLEKERFVVEAANTRVAVHGTVFRVRLDADRTVVDVEQGVVAVGPLERARAAATLLRAPIHAEFALSGAPLDTHQVAVNAPTGGTRPSPLHKQHRAAPEASASSESDRPAPPPVTVETTINQRRTIGEVEAGVGPVVAAVTRCFREGSSESGNLRVTAKSSLTLQVAPDGSIGRLSFDPPLSPNVQSCSEAAIAHVRFARSVEGTSVTRVLELTR